MAASTSDLKPNQGLANSLSNVFKLVSFVICLSTTLLACVVVVIESSVQFTRSDGVLLKEI